MRLLITAGPTREHFDPVRYISNASSGKFGVCIAKAARLRGHDVVLVSGPVHLAAPDVKWVSVVSAQQMLEACETEFATCDAAVMTAAVADWRPQRRLAGKKPKSETDLTVQLEPTPDICAALGRVRGRRVVVGFALQDDAADAQSRAERKLREKGCDAIVLNAPDTIGAEGATVQIKVSDQPWGEPVTADKTRLGEIVVELIERLVEQKNR